MNCLWCHRRVPVKEGCACGRKAYVIFGDEPYRPETPGIDITSMLRTESAVKSFKGFGMDSHVQAQKKG